MKEVTMFMFEGCPHCRKAKEMMDALFAEKPEYAEVPLTVIDEKRQPEVADKYDYFYVPTFFVGEEKIHEGIPTKEAIEHVFKKAYNG
ncbi:MAG: glutaredoxin [Synergistaceae bacterium]|nr:glutaredoxin [Synergistaceae bacterium]